VSPESPNYTELRQLVVTAITGQGEQVEAVNWGPCLAEARKENILQVAFSEPINPAGTAYNDSFTYYILALHGSPEIHPVRPGVGCGTFETTIDWQRQANALLPTSRPTNATRCERTDFRITSAIYNQETGNTTVNLLNTGSTTFSFLLTVKSDTATTTEAGELLIDDTANISLHSGQPVQTVKAFAVGCPNSTVTSNVTR
ncbi:MAG: hypothetical protein SV186_02085, partial [Candidatus Nanohaloarchaea archaeon]|nr:hypothetical protein [Candidatus Nanohaloarchaea archaeon]